MKVKFVLILLCFVELLILLKCYILSLLYVTVNILKLHLLYVTVNILNVNKSLNISECACPVEIQPLHPTIYSCKICVELYQLI